MADHLDFSRLPSAGQGRFDFDDDDALDYEIEQLLRSIRRSLPWCMRFVLLLHRWWIGRGGMLVD